MDVQKEIRAADARVQRRIDLSAKEALARLDARWPSQVEPVAVPSAAEQYGRYLRQMNDALVAMAEGIARGWNSVGTPRKKYPR